MTDATTQAEIIAAVKAQTSAIKTAIKAALLRKWLKESEAAAYLGCSTKEISRLRLSGALRGGLLGKQWRYHVDDLDRAVLMGRSV